VTTQPPTAFDAAGLQLPSVEGEARGGALRTNIARVLRQRSAVVGLSLLGFLLFIALFANFIAPYGERVSMLDLGEPGVHTRDAPCIHILGCDPTRPEHFFGLDGNARDEFSRVIYGARISLAVGFITVIWSIVAGMFIGAVAGFAGGRVDNLLMRLMDMLLAFPSLLLAIVVVTVVGKGLIYAMFAIGIVSIPVYARVMRSSVLTVREQDYVTAARALGDSSLSILRRRVIPNAITPIIVQGTLGVGTAILEVAALSFLGLTAVAPAAEWGSMIGQERNQIFTSPILVFLPGLALTLTVLGFNLLGDGLRDAFDPRLSR
jgi:ABC-type dipeptide/oligopeptide/nickel transport system permease subunit